MRVHTMVAGMLQTNCYTIYDPQLQIASVVDPCADADGIIGFLNENHLTLKNIFITHSHFDHMLAAAPLRDLTGARVVVHAFDEPGMVSAKDALYLSIAPEPYRICKPDILVYGGEKTLIGEVEAEIIHTPGHTPGSICIAIDNTLFTGDTLFEGNCGRTDLKGGNSMKMRESLRLLYSLEYDYIVYPGHGNPTALSMEKCSNPAVLEAVGKA